MKDDDINELLAQLCDNAIENIRVVQRYAVTADQHVKIEEAITAMNEIKCRDLIPPICHQ